MTLARAHIISEDVEAAIEKKFPGAEVLIHQDTDDQEQDAPRGPGLRIGLAAIKTVGEGAVRPIVADRKENGPYKSIDDFSRRAGASGLNRRTLESLAKAGAFDCLATRGSVMNALDQITATAQREARTRDSGQSSMFDGHNFFSHATRVVVFELKRAHHNA